MLMCLSKRKSNIRVTRLLSGLTSLYVIECVIWFWQRRQKPELWIRNQASEPWRGCIFTVQRVNLEAGHLLGQDGLWQVEQSRVVDGEVAVITVQHPDSCPLDTETHQRHSKYRSNISCTHTSHDNNSQYHYNLSFLCLSREWIHIL